MRKSSTVLGLLCLSLVGLYLTGCSQSGGQAKLTDKDRKDFKGGPMPPEASKKMAERMRAASEAAKAKTAGKPAGGAGQAPPK